MAASDEVLRILFQTVADTAGAEQAAAVVQKVAVQLKAEAASAKEAAAAEKSLDAARRSSGGSSEGGGHGGHGGSQAAAQSIFAVHNATQAAAQVINGNFVPAVNNALYAVSDLSGVFSSSTLGFIGMGVAALGAGVGLGKLADMHMRLASDVALANDATAVSVRHITNRAAVGEVLSAVAKKEAEAIKKAAEEQRLASIISKGYADQIEGLIRSLSNLEHTEELRRGNSDAERKRTEDIKAAEIDLEVARGKISQEQGERMKRDRALQAEVLQQQLDNIRRETDMRKIMNQQRKLQNDARLAEEKAARGEGTKEDARKASDDFDQYNRQAQKRLETLRNEFVESQKQIEAKKKLVALEDQGSKAAEDLKNSEEAAQKAAQAKAKAEHDTANQRDRSAKAAEAEANADAKPRRRRADGRERIDGHAGPDARADKDRAANEAFFDNGGVAPSPSMDTLGRTRRPHLVAEPPPSSSMNWLHRNNGGPAADSGASVKAASNQAAQSADAVAKAALNLAKQQNAANQQVIAAYQQVNAALQRLESQFKNSASRSSR